MTPDEYRADLAALQARHAEMQALVTQMAADWQALQLQMAAMREANAAARARFKDDEDTEP